MQVASKILQSSGNSNGIFGVDGSLSWTSLKSPFSNVGSDVGGRPTGCVALDGLFFDEDDKEALAALGDRSGGGGWPLGRTIELLGKAGSGRTAIAISTAVACAIEGHSVLLIDTCNAIQGSQLKEAASSQLGQGLSDRVSQVLERIQFRRVFDPWALLDVLSASAARTYGIVILDCLHSIVAPYFSGGMHSGLGFPHTIVSPLLTSIGVLMRAVSATGATMLVTNDIDVSRSTSSSRTVGAVGGIAPQSSSLRDAPPSAFTDIFDISLVVRKDEVASQVRFEISVLARPRYLKMSLQPSLRQPPVSCMVDFRELNCCYQNIPRTLPQPSQFHQQFHPQQQQDSR